MRIALRGLFFCAKLSTLFIINVLTKVQNVVYLIYKLKGSNHMSTMLLEPELETPTTDNNQTDYYVASLSSQSFAYDASVKPRKDIQTLALKAGYKPAYLPMFGNYANRLQDELEEIKDNSLVLLQVPTYNSLATDQAMVDGLKAKGCTLVTSGRKPPYFSEGI